MTSPIRTQLNPITIRRLDAVRGIAALYVVLCHTGLRGFPYGGEAVIAFFLLSGFVIHANEGHRAQVEPLRYLGRRLRRLYPVLLSAVGLVIIVAGLEGTLARDFNLIQLIATLAAVWPFLHNAPLWSLSYEALYYLAYPVLLAVPARYRLTLVAIVSAISLAIFNANPFYFFQAGSLLIVWWAGAEAARLYGTGRVCDYLPVTFGLAGMFILALLLATQLSGVARASSGRAFLAALAFFVISLTAPGWAKHLFDHVMEPFAAIAPISYGLYVLHMPLVTMPGPVWLHLLAGVPLTFLLAWVAESALRKGGWISSAFAILSRRLAASRRQLASVLYPAGAEQAQAAALVLEAEQV
jgi:peptidoglycan/LPS O-acetylase OafA/YrhL